MGRAKEIVMKVIPSKIAIPFVKKHHYSGSVVYNSKLHFGAFLNGKLHGVMSYGPSMDKSKVLSLVEGTGWNEMLELNRMAFDDYLPRNSESRCISQSIKLIKKNAPQVKWILSFADGCSCGDGTIYRASNFVLTGIKKNTGMCLLPSGKKIHEISFKANPTVPRKELNGRSLYDISGGKYSRKKYLEAAGAKLLEGYQLRYIYFIDKSCRQRLTVPKISFSKIDEIGAGMYKGQRILRAERVQKIS
jgi:hypothetical protein